jgi:hypothetical protein
METKTPNTPSEVPDEPRHTFESGAQRSKIMPRFDLIPETALVRLAGRYEVGLPYGEHNYKLGLPFDDTYNHIVSHLLAYKERRKAILAKAAIEKTSMDAGILYATMKKLEVDGDDLAGAMWGIATIMYLESTGRLL